MPNFKREAANLVHVLPVFNLTIREIRELRLLFVQESRILQRKIEFTRIAATRLRVWQSIANERFPAGAAGRGVLRPTFPERGGNWVRSCSRGTDLAGPGDQPLAADFAAFGCY